LMAWVMPQYPHAYAGPLFASSSGDSYFVGQGDYRTGDGGFLDAGSPVFRLRLGRESATYLLKGFKPGLWKDVAVTRTGSKMSLYVDGVLMKPIKIIDPGRNKVVPAPELTIAPGFVPGGTLRFGRSGGGSGQLYGLIDDVALFRRALTSSELK